MVRLHRKNFRRTTAHYMACLVRKYLEQRDWALAEARAARRASSGLAYLYIRRARHAHHAYLKAVRQLGAT